MSWVGFGTKNPTWLGLGKQHGLVQILVLVATITDKDGLTSPEN